MTKMAATPIYGKTLKNLLQNRWADFHETEEITKMLMKIFISYNFKNLCIFAWTCFRNGGTDFRSRYLGHMTAMPCRHDGRHAHYGKNPSKSSSQEPVGRFPRNLVCSTGNSSPSKFAQMVTLG